MQNEEEFDGQSRDFLLLVHPEPDFRQFSIASTFFVILHFAFSVLHFSLSGTNSTPSPLAPG
jgi:hypothetical protein